MKNLIRGIVMDVLPCKLWDIVLEETGQTPENLLVEQNIHNGYMNAGRI